jgi:hypothetical protein
VPGPVAQRVEPAAQAGKAAEAARLGQVLVLASAESAALVRRAARQPGRRGAQPAAPAPRVQAARPERALVPVPAEPVQRAVRQPGRRAAQPVAPAPRAVPAEQALLLVLVPAALLQRARVRPAAMAVLAEVVPAEAALVEAPRAAARQAPPRPVQAPSGQAPAASRPVGARGPRVAATIRAMTEAVARWRPSWPAPSTAASPPGYRARSSPARRSYPAAGRLVGT